MNTDDEEFDTIEPEFTENGENYLLMPNPDYNKGKPADGAFAEGDHLDTIVEPNPEPKVSRVTGGIALEPTPAEPVSRVAQARTNQPAEAFRPEDAVRALKPVSEEYSEHLGELDKGVRQVAIILSRKMANILTHVPQEYQARAVATERAKADRAKLLLEMKRAELGGEIYAKLDDEGVLEADRLRAAGVDGVRAAKLADRHTKVQGLSDSILTEAEGDPRVHAALVEKLYGTPQRDPQTGEVQKDEAGQPVRLGGLIKKNQYGALDVTNESKFERLVADAKASEDYRNDKATKRMREAGRGTKGSSGSSGSESMDTPRLKNLRGQESDVMSQINFLKDDRGDNYKEDSAYKVAADQLRAIQTHIGEENNFITARHNAILEQMGQGPLDTIIKGTVPDQNAGTIKKNTKKREVYDLQTQQGRLQVKVDDAAKGKNDADARVAVNAAKELFAKEGGMKIIKSTNGLELVGQLSNLGDKPQMFLFDGKIGAGFGLQAGIMDRDAVNKWAEIYSKPEKAAKFEQQFAQSNQARGRLSKDITRHLPDAEFNASGFVEDGNYGEHARLVANYNQALDSERRADEGKKVVAKARDILKARDNPQEPEPESEYTEDRYRKGKGTSSDPSSAWEPVLF